MPTRLFALVVGVFYVVVGILGFISVVTPSPPADAPHLDLSANYGYLFGAFPVNAIHNAGNIVIGLAGIIAGSRLLLARYYCQTLFILFGVLTFMGFMPTADTMWGVCPILTADTWVHAVTSVAAGYFGFVAPDSTHVEPAHAVAH